MKGLWLEENRLSLRGDLPEPVSASGEALLEVVRAGICGTDLEMLSGYANFVGVPGHEFVARVVDGPPSWRDRRVVVDINIACGECANCLRGLPSHCEARLVVGIRHHQGAFAERLCVPARNLHLIPDAINDEVAVLVEPLAAAIEILEQVSLRGEERVLVVGAGRLAQLVAQVLATKMAGLDIYVRRLRRRRWFDDLDRVTCVDRPQAGYDVVVDCSGSHDGFNAAVRLVRPRGTIVLKSTFASQREVDLSSIVVNEVTVVGSRCGPMAKAIEWLNDGLIETEFLTFESFALEDFESAFARARDLAVYKVTLVP